MAQLLRSNICGLLVVAMIFRSLRPWCHSDVTVMPREELGSWQSVASCFATQVGATVCQINRWVCDETTTVRVNIKQLTSRGHHFGSIPSSVVFLLGGYLRIATRWTFKYGEMALWVVLGICWPPTWRGCRHEPPKLRCRFHQKGLISE